MRRNALTDKQLRRLPACPTRVCQLPRTICPARAASPLKEECANGQTENAGRPRQRRPPGAAGQAAWQLPVTLVWLSAAGAGAAARGAGVLCADAAGDDRSVEVGAGQQRSQARGQNRRLVALALV